MLCWCLISIWKLQLKTFFFFFFLIYWTVLDARKEPLLKEPCPNGIYGWLHWPRIKRIVFGIKCAMPRTASQECLAYNTIGRAHQAGRKAMWMHPATVTSASCMYYIVCVFACLLLYMVWKLTENQHHHAVKLFLQNEFRFSLHCILRRVTRMVTNKS